MSVLVLMGASGVGKDAVGKELQKKGFSQIVTWTTRPMRDYETNGVQHWFTTQEDFDKKREEGFFAESYDRNGIWGKCSYGTSKESLIAVENKYIILNYEGYLNIKDSLGDSADLLPVLLTATDMTLRSRLFGRANKEKDLAKEFELMQEVDIRLADDAERFKDSNTWGVFEVCAEEPVVDVANLVYRYYQTYIAYKEKNKQCKGQMLN